MKTIWIQRIFIGLFLCIAFTACCDCSEYSEEQYPETDTLSLLSHPQWNIKLLYSDIGELEADLPEGRGYRMFYKHSFEHFSSVIRLEKSSVGCTVKCIMTQEVEEDGKWRTEILSRNKKSLSMYAWIAFEGLMKQANFWSSPQLIDRHGLDGQSIMLEGYRPDAVACDKRAYHLIHRWTPEDQALKDAVALLLKYAEIEDLPGGR